MIKRIVMMELQPGKEALFLDIFNHHKERIRAQEGCKGLEVLKSEKDGNISVWTISLWLTVEDLDRYRSSALFQEMWPEVKLLFSGKAQAWTLTPIEIIA
jgi:heme-degrading monooxygenase HmoA